METANKNLKVAAITTGASLSLMTLAAGFSVGYAFDFLFVEGDAATTTANLKSNEMLFRAGLAGFVLILILDLLVAWGLGQVFEHVHQGFAKITAWARLLYTTILGVAIASLLGIFPLLEWPVGEADATILLVWQLFNAIWSMGLIVFGLHLMGVGVLAFKSGFVPKWLGILLLIGGVGYLVISAGNLLIPDFASAKSILDMIFMLPMIIGEVGLGIYLLVKSGKLARLSLSHD